MSVIGGIISIKDNATATLRAVKTEVTSVRSATAQAKKELTKTWEKKYTAKLDNTAASKKIKQVAKDLEPLKKKVVTALAVKDAVTEKVQAVTSKIKVVGKMVAKPVVDIAVKGMSALKSVGSGILKVGKVAAVGLGAVAAGAGLALGMVFSGAEDEAFAAMESMAKLQQVMSNTMNASAADVQSVMDVINQQERTGVIGGDVQQEGLQELGTYLEEKESMQALLPVMNDMLAQQYGINATQENAVNIGTMMGKVMNGQTSALSRLGYSFDAAQESVLKYGTEAERAATLAEVIQQSVGGMNQALAETDIGRIKQVENTFGQLKEKVGDSIIGIKGQLAGLVMSNMPAIEGMVGSLTGTMEKAAAGLMPILEKALGKVVPLVEKVLPVVGDIVLAIIPKVESFFDALNGDTSGPMGAIGVLTQNFRKLMPVFKQFGGSVLGTLKTVFETAMPLIASVVSTVQATLPAILPVISTVVETIGNLFEKAAPLIAGLVDLIGSAVSGLAPVFQTIFSGIGDKVGSVVTFISNKMGFLTEVINWAVPMVSDILSTAWTVVEPVLDIAKEAFKLLFNVAEEVFPAIQAVIETVWDAIKPIVENIAFVFTTIGEGIGWVSEQLGLSSGNGTIEVKGNSKNVTWAKPGSEQVPKAASTQAAENVGSTVPAPETSHWAKPGGAQPTEPASAQVPSSATGAVPPPVIESIVVEIDSSDFDFPEWPDPTGGGYPTSGAAAMPTTGWDFPSTPGMAPQVVEEHNDYSVSVELASVAGTIIVKEEADLDALAAMLVERVAAAVANNQPKPATT